MALRPHPLRRRADGAASMTIARRVTLAAGLVLFMAWLSLAYGPSRRVFSAAPGCVAVGTGQEILSLWTRAGVKGRVAVLFSRRLNGEPGLPASAGVRYLEDAMDRGIVRTAYHLVPDPAWSEVASALSRWRFAHEEPPGYVAMMGQGRVYVRPLSRPPEIDERALVVVAPNDFDAAESQRIAALLKRAGVRTDLMAVLRGEGDQGLLLCDAMDEGMTGRRR